MKKSDITEFAGSVQSYINRKPVSAMRNEELGYACGDERKVSKLKNDRMITVSRFDSISSDVVDLASQFSREALPGFSELAELAQITAVGLRVICLEENNACCAISCCYVEDTRIGGISVRAYRDFGHDFFDYCALHYKPGYRERLVAEIYADAKEAGADCVFLKGVLLEDDFRAPKLALYSFPTQIFRKSISDNSFAALLRKKSVKRHVNSCKREYEYTCEHFSGEEISVSDLEQMSTMHIETRRYHDTVSAFECSSGVQIKKYMASRQNRILTKISTQTEVIAFHYGLICGDTMVWHTPVINIKFLESSPLEVLLFETLSFCEKEGIEVFDLGEGDEPYKERFSNDQRSVFDLILPVTVTGRAAKSMKDMEYKFHLREKAKEVGNFFLSGKEAFATGVFKPKGYKWSPDTRSESGSNNLLLLENFASLVDFARCSGLRLNRRYYDNLRAGLAFCALKAKDDDWYSHCWLSRSDTLYIPETNASIDVAFDVSIFGFGSTSRRQACDIESLARQVAVKLESANIAAYVLSPDKALSKQISEAGFTRIGK